MDKDLVEARWVEAVDAAIAETRDDPWSRQEKFKDIQAEYWQNVKGHMAGGEA